MLHDDKQRCSPAQVVAEVDALSQLASNHAQQNSATGPFRDSSTACIAAGSAEALLWAYIWMLTRAWAFEPCS